MSIYIMPIHLSSTIDLLRLQPQKPIVERKFKASQSYSFLHANNTLAAVSYAWASPAANYIGTTTSTSSVEHVDSPILVCIERNTLKFPNRWLNELFVCDFHS